MRIVRALAIGTLGLAIGLFAYLRLAIVDMPGSASGGVAIGTPLELKQMADRLRGSVEVLSVDIGGRSIYNPGALDEAAAWIEHAFERYGWEPKVQGYAIPTNVIQTAIDRRNERLRSWGSARRLPEYNARSDSIDVANIWIEIPGSEVSSQYLLIGAHYDTVSPECPGADDNASGVAGLLELARHFREAKPRTNLLLAAFTCEEYPVGGIDLMGSAVFARSILEDEGKTVAGMISLEMLGYYSDEPKSQSYPVPFSYFYPDTANFIAFVGNAGSRAFIRSIAGAFREASSGIPSYGVAAPIWLAPDVMRSDHEPFATKGIPSLMVTDTSNFRYGEYLHSASDTIEKLDFDRMAKVVDGLKRVLLAFEP